MCGIAGIYSFGGQPFERTTLKKMGDAIAHRGPDDDRYLLWHPDIGNRVYQHEVPPGNEQPLLGFAHRRLSIVDVSHGHQPMANEDNTCWICYNGEVYNHLDLKPALISAGHRFNTNCDTEVTLHLYEQFGPDSVSALNGIYAYAIWDSKQRQLFLARDRFGTKPLYYTVFNQMLIFASEIKAILQLPGIPRIPDPLTIADHFTFQNHFSDHTFFEGIKLLPAGHWLVCKEDGSIIEQPYWQMRHVESDKLDEEAIASELRFHFENAVKRQLMSEVPLGTFLSGGMDTGSISAVAGRSIPHMHTFTCGFNVPPDADDLEQYFDESAESFALANLLGSQHHEIRLDSHHNFPSIPFVAWALEEPRLGISYQNWYTSRLIRQHVTVVLGGGGGDELFGGYVWRYQNVLAQDYSTFNWNEHYYREWIRFFDDKEKLVLFSDNFNQCLAGYSSYDSFTRVMKDVHIDDPLDRAFYFDAKTFLHGLLVVEDKLSMAHSIESRVPFLDNDLVQYVLSIPSHLKVKNGAGKYILKKAMQGLLPDEVLTRRKQGFTPPDASWYRGSLRTEVENLLLSDRALSRDYFKPEIVKKIVTEHMTGERNRRFLLWSLMVFEWWNRLYLDGESLPAITSVPS